MIERPLIGEPHQYRGCTIEVRHMGPDLLAYVDGIEIPHFYLTQWFAREAGERFVDHMLAMTDVRRS